MLFERSFYPVGILLIMISGYALTLIDQRLQMSDELVIAACTCDQHVESRIVFFCRFDVFLQTVPMFNDAGIQLLKMKGSASSGN